MYSLSFEGTEELPQPQVTFAMEQHGGGVRTSRKPAASPGHQANSLAAVPRVWSPGHRTLRPSHTPYADSASQTLGTRCEGPPWRGGTTVRADKSDFGAS